MKGNTQRDTKGSEVCIQLHETKKRPKNKTNIRKCQNPKLTDPIRPSIGEKGVARKEK